MGSFILPVLSDAEAQRRDDRMEWLKCPGEAIMCPTCPISTSNPNAVDPLCSGGCCSSKKKEVKRQRECLGACNSCGGGGYMESAKVDVSAVCGHSTLRDSWGEMFRRPLPEAYETKPLKMAQRVIYVLYKANAKMYGPVFDKFKELEWFAVSLTSLISVKNGRLVTKDAKDYLSLSPSKKLILFTYCPDQYQERIWARWDKSFAHLNVDEWMGLEYGAYYGDSNFMQSVCIRRTQLHTVRCQSPFVWYSQGETLDMRAAWKRFNGVGNVAFACPFQNITKHDAKTLISETIFQMDHIFKKDAVFYFVGGTNLVSRIMLSYPKRQYRIFDTRLHSATSRYQKLESESVTKESRIPQNELAEHGLAGLMEHNLKMRLGYYKKLFADPRSMKLSI